MIAKNSPTWGRQADLQHTLRGWKSQIVASFLATITLSGLAAGNLGATQIFGVDVANNLVRFEPATPGTIVSTVPITGLAGGETILGIDFRPQDGKLFALGSTSRLYIIDYTSNPAAVTATPIGNAGAFTLSGTFFGFDFNPTVDRIRVVSDADQNLRLNPNDGTLAAVDSALNPGNPNVVGSGYLNSVAGATTTTLYGIDSATDALVIQNPPNNGTLTTVGTGLGVDVGSDVGFDIEGISNTAYMAAVLAGTERLFIIDLTTGTAALIGTIGSGTTLRGIAVAPTAFNANLIGTTATFNGSAANDNISFDQSGGLLRHNRFTFGDAAFNSDFDFDSTTPGDQTLSATDPTVTIIVNAGGADDTVTIGSAVAPPAFILPTFQINGQGGGDRLTINDSTNTTGQLITVNGATATITGLGGPITTGTVELVDLLAGLGPDTINISGTTAALTSINAGGGSDTVIFADGASLSGGLLDGGAGIDTVDYSAYTTSVLVTLVETETLLFGLLSGAQEPGPLSSSPGSGTGVFRLNAAQTEMRFDIIWNGLVGATITGEHFHNAAAGVNGTIVRGLSAGEQVDTIPPDGSAFGFWSSSDPAGIGGVPSSGPLTPALVTELLANRIYFNVHTNLFPSGELRAQLINSGMVGTAIGVGGIRGFENVTGGSAPDALTGSSAVNILRGGGDHDVLVGGQGGDQVFGDAGDDVLVWNNGDGSDLMEGGADSDTVQVNGSPTGGDAFLIQVNPADPARLRFDRTNLGLFNLNIGTVEALFFSTSDGNDTTTVEYAGGNPIPSNGLLFSGGAGSDRLVLQRSAGNFLATAMTHNAAGPGEGSVFVNGQGGIITYTGLEPVDDTVPATTFTFNAPLASNEIHVVNGPDVSMFATLQINDGGTNQFELVNIARKSNVIINSATPDQLVVIDNTVASTDLTSLTINTSTGDDEIDIIALAAGVMTHVNSSSSSDFIRVVGAGIAVGASLQLDGSGGFDHLVYETGGVSVTTTPGPGVGQTTVTRTGSGSVIYQSFEDVDLITGTPTVAQPLNISTRMRVQTGDNVLIGGFIITGNQDKKVIVRALGPSLAQAGLSNLLADPQIELHGPDGALIASNDNWKDTQQTEIQNSGLPPQNDLESAIVTTLPPNGYTVIVKGKNNTSGLGLVEGYDLDPAAASQFANLSTRGFVQTGDNVMIGGFILGNNSGSARIVIRGLGPSLAQAGVANILADPTLDVYDSNGSVLISNDDWMDNPGQAVQLTAAGLAPSRSEEAAVLITLAPGAYTAILRGANDTTGVGLVELYNLQ